MKFPSVQTLAADVKYVIVRFPFEITFALAGTLAATINIELRYSEHDASNWCIRVMIGG